MSSIFSSARFLTRSLFGGLILALSLGLAIFLDMRLHRLC
jgi:hypothetical protein